MKRDTVTSVIYYYITTAFHYVKRDSRLSAYGGEVLELRSVIFVTKIHVSKFRLKWTINVFPHT